MKCNSHRLYRKVTCTLEGSFNDRPDVLIMWLNYINHTFNISSSRADNLHHGNGAPQNVPIRHVSLSWLPMSEYILFALSSPLNIKNLPTCF